MHFPLKRADARPRPISTDEFGSSLRPMAFQNCEWAEVLRDISYDILYLAHAYR
jgi:hypothetical protein